MRNRVLLEKYTISMASIYWYTCYYSFLMLLKTHDDTVSGKMPINTYQNA